MKYQLSLTNQAGDVVSTHIFATLDEAADALDHMGGEGWIETVEEDTC